MPMLNVTTSTSLTAVYESPRNFETASIFSRGATTRTRSPSSMTVSPSGTSSTSPRRTRVTIAPKRLARPISASRRPAIVRFDTKTRRKSRTVRSSSRCSADASPSRACAASTCFCAPMTDTTSPTASVTSSGARVTLPSRLSRQSTTRTFASASSSRAGRAVASARVTAMHALSILGAATTEAGASSRWIRRATNSAARTPSTPIGYATE